MYSFFFSFSDLKNMEAVAEALSTANHDFSMSLYTVGTRLLIINYMDILIIYFEFFCRNWPKQKLEIFSTLRSVFI